MAAKGSQMDSPLGKGVEPKAIISKINKKDLSLKLENIKKYNKLNFDQVI